MVAPLAGAADVVQAATAELRVIGVAADIGAVVPAAGTAAVGTGLERQTQARELGGLSRLLALGQGMHPGLGGQQDKAQLLAQGLQLTAQLGSAEEIHLGLEAALCPAALRGPGARSEEHTSELQS